MEQKKGSEHTKTADIKTPFMSAVLRDPEGTQTLDLQNRNLTLYSTELPGHFPEKRCKGKNYLPFTIYCLLFFLEYGGFFCGAA